MSLLHRARFFTTVANNEQLLAPELSTGCPEIAFVGRSNAGKSTAINLLCNQKQLAFASKMPGRTQHLNYFSVADREHHWGFLVDLPGYGYAQTGLEMRTQWDGFLGGYLRDRTSLRGIVLMMDARRPLTDLDLLLLDWVGAAGRPVHALLTKADKLNRSDTAQALASVRKAFEGTDFTAQTFSALKRVGLEDAESKLLQWLDAPIPAPRVQKTPLASKPSVTAAAKKKPR
jgi:GTP-binding protein